MLNPRFIIKLTLLTLVISSIGGYAYYKSQNLIEGPIISIENPSNGMVWGDSILDIEGIAQNISQISLNDRDITVNGDGEFKERVILWPGYNVIKISAKDRLGRERIEILEVIHRESDRLTIDSNKSDILYPHISSPPERLQPFSRAGSARE